jgi:zinc transport system permease protein
MEFLQALADHAFLQRALLAGLLASVACGLTGSLVVVKRIGYLAGGIAHSVLGGMGVALFFGVAPLLGAAMAAVLAALLIGWIRLRGGAQEDSLISAVWAIGMAVGVVFISMTPGYATDLTSYLFGNILLVGSLELWLLAGLDLLLLALLRLFYPQLLATSFDEEFARLRGIPVTMFYLLFLCLVSLTVVMLVRVVGLILVIALLTLPAATAARQVDTLGRMMLVASIIGMLCSGSGLALAYQLDLPAGAVIILCCGGLYLLSLLLRPALLRGRSRAAS